MGRYDLEEMPAFLLDFSGNGGLWDADNRGDGNGRSPRHNFPNGNANHHPATAANRDGDGRSQPHAHANPHPS